MANRYSEEIINKAKTLYMKRMTPREIADNLSLPGPRIIYAWAEKYAWGELLSEEGALEAIERRIAVLSPREKKTEMQLRELEVLINCHIKLIAQKNKHAEKMAAIAGPSLRAAADDTPDGEAPRKKRRRKNDISDITAEMLDEWAESSLYKHQLHARANKHHKTRNILKARQIGMTYAFAFEALEDAILTGDQQIFLSASRTQAEVFRDYIIAIAREAFGVTLTGNPIKLSNGAVLRFLSTNSNTAQSHSGNLYCDEYFWIPKFERMNAVASAMATQIKRRITYFSTPSTRSHQAYPMWTGDEWRKGRAERKNIEFPTFDEMRTGIVCPDKQWRYVITIKDAIAGGFDLVDVEDLHDRHSESAFNMLFMCIFVDDKESVFSFKDLEKCTCEAGKWEDFNAADPRPFGDREVWGGFDPARTGDNATFVVLAPPVFAVEKFRLLEKYHWRGLAFSWMAEQIQTIKNRYNMTYIGVDVTGIGAGVFELIQHFARREARAIIYNVEEKNRLVMKMLDLVQSNRIEWDENLKEVAASFLAIRQTSTASGNALTFVADRTVETGHADVFFAMAHAAIKEPLAYKHKRKSTWSL